jgi:CrcB protein
MIALWIGCAGGMGALARYELAGFVARKIPDPRPWGTLVVNVTGSAATGALVAAGWPHDVSSVVGTGFLGGFTTFSTWMVESARLAEEGMALWSVMNLTAMVVAGLGAAWITGGSRLA